MGGKIFVYDVDDKSFLCSARLFTLRCNKLNLSETRISSPFINSRNCLGTKRVQNQLELRARIITFHFYQKHFYGTALEGAISADAAAASGKLLRYYGVSEMHQLMSRIMFWQMKLKLA